MILIKTIILVAPDLGSIFAYVFSQERLLTLVTVIIAIIIYELLKKGVKKGVSYITARKTKVGLLILIITILLAMVFLI